MKKKAALENGNVVEEHLGITRVTVAGYKSIAKEQSIEVRPLTILAGANSSGKSSLIQPLLILKQTLESSYDPGALLLDGPNVRFTSANQFFSAQHIGKRLGRLRVGLVMASLKHLSLSFAHYKNRGVEVVEMEQGSAERIYKYRVGMSSDDISRLFIGFREAFGQKGQKINWKLVRERCFLKPVLIVEENGQEKQVATVQIEDDVISGIREIIHIPGLRGNPLRTYPLTPAGETFAGTFENYTASVIAKWQNDKNNKLSLLNSDLLKLGLTNVVTAKTLNDTQVEVRVGRLQSITTKASQDLVSIADVGFGVSQTLPVLVALQVAHPGQLVYIEQPEIHLHPRAQTAMAQVLADAALRGVRVVAETHSSLLLLGIQTLVAEGKLPPGLVKLHWFSRNKDGETTIRSADLDDAGAFGNWPEDFADVALEAESRYLDAAEARQHIH
ncbi:MAG: AAA family ATPase [Blastocatellales bacterium]